MRANPLAAIVLIALSSAALAGDYGQWRGPNRNGVAPAGPTLAATWPKAGPRKLWESDEIPRTGNGGYGSVAVAGGKVYTYINWRYNVPFDHRTLSKGRLRSLGGFGVKLPAELEKAVEAARVSEERTKLVRKELNEWMKKWVADHLKTPDEARKYGQFARDRLYRGKNALPLDLLAKLDTIADKKFDNQADLDKWFADNGIDKKLATTVRRVIPTYEAKAWDVVLCVNAADGKTLWKFQDDGTVVGHGSSATPCVVGDRCYVAGSTGQVYCLNAATGEKIWKTAATERPAVVHSSPLVADGVVVVLARNLVGLDAEKGDLLWRQPKVRGQHNSPVAWVSGGKTRIVCNTGSTVACAEMKTGKLLWQVPGGGQSTAAIDGDHMAVFTSNKKVGLAVYKLSDEKAELLWSKPEWVDGAASPIVHGDYVYALGKGLAVCAKLADGEVAWQQKIGGSGYTSPVLAGDKIVVFVGGVVCLVDAAPGEYKLLAKAPLHASQYTSPAVADGKLYLRLEKTMACFDATAAADETPPAPAK